MYYVVFFAVMFDTAYAPFIALILHVIDVKFYSVTTVERVKTALKITVRVKKKRAFLTNRTVQIIENFISIAEVRECICVFFDKLKFIGICNFFGILECE